MSVRHALCLTLLILSVGCEQEPPPAAEPVGALTITVSPSEATITLTPPGAEPMTMTSPVELEETSVGTYTLQVELDGYRTLERTLSVKDGEHTQEALALEPDTGMLITGASGEAVITGPKDYEETVTLPATLGGLEPGVYHIRPTSGEARFGAVVHAQTVRGVNLEDAKQGGLVVGDIHFTAPTGVTLKNFNAPDGFDFHDWDRLLESVPEEARETLNDTRPHKRVYSTRDKAFPEAFDPESFTRLQSQVRSIVLHSDAAVASEENYKRLASRGLSTHILIDHDGIVYQALDLDLAAWASGKMNPYAINIDLNNPFVEAAANASPKRGLHTGTINGEEISRLGYTDPQYESLIALTRDLLVLFDIPPTTLMEGDAVRSAAVDPVEPDTLSGILGHHHVSPEKSDPGPGFEWERFLSALQPE